MSRMPVCTSLCETSEVAYLAYLACVAVANGFAVSAEDDSGASGALLCGVKLLCRAPGGGSCGGMDMGYDAGETTGQGFVETDGTSGRRSGVGGVDESSECELGGGSGDGTGNGDDVVGQVSSGEQLGSSSRSLASGVSGSGVESLAASRGVNYERNKRNREEQKRRKQRRKEIGQDWRKGKSVRVENGGKVSSQGFWNSCSSELRQQLIDSKARMHIAENDRIAEKAKRQLAVYNANDVEVEVKRYGTGMRASLERSMVSIEKTHGTLVATGNVPGEFHGSAETVVSASSGSISPNSSVSEAEVRKMQKDLLDRDAVIEKFEKRFGVQAAMLDYIDKDIWTENSENDRILDEFCPDGYAKDTSYTPEGKFRLIV